MKQLTRYEELALECLLKKEKRNAEEFLEKNPDSFEAYFVKNETLPVIESLLAKLEV